VFRILTVALFLFVLNASFADDCAADSATGTPDAIAASDGSEPIGDATGRAAGFTPGAWQTGFEMPNGCSWWIDTIAAGPNGMLYLGGGARVCGGVAGRLYSYDPVTRQFASLGAFTNPGGSSPRVFDITIDGNHLYAVGRFKFIDGVEVNHVARYELSSGTWSSIGDGNENGITVGLPRAVEADSNSVYVGFGREGESRVGTLEVNSIARWDISSQAWSAMNGGLVLADDLDPTSNLAAVHDLALVGGTLYVGGSFQSAGGAPIEGLATFAPVSGWSQLGSGIEGTVVAVDSDGTTVYAATNDAVSEFDGATWSTVASDLSGFELSSSLPNVLLLTDGFLYLGGWFTAVDGFEASNVARFNLSSREWESLGTGTGNGVTGSIIGFLFQTAVDSLAKIGDDIYISGSLTGAGTDTINNIARWNATTYAWAPIGPAVGKGVSAQDIWALATDGTEVLTAGPLTQSGLEPTRWVGRFDIVTGTWSAFGDESTRELLGVTSQIDFAGGGIFANVSEGLTDSLDSLSTFENVNGIVRWDPAAQDWAKMGPADSPGLTNAGSTARSIRLAGGATHFMSAVFSGVRGILGLTTSRAGTSRNRLGRRWALASTPRLEVWPSRPQARCMSQVLSLRPAVFPPTMRQCGIQRPGCGRDWAVV